MSADNQPWRQYICRACGLIYDEELGDPDSGLEPGTRFEDIPDDWECPLCGVTKSDFELFERQEIAVAEQVTSSRGETGIVVVGADIAGWSVVEAIRSLDARVPVTMVTACHGDRYHKPELSVAMSRGQSPEQLIRETGVDAARRLGINLMADTYVVGVSSQTHQLRTTRGSLDYTRLVLAQGARAALPDTLPPHLCWRINDLASWQGLHARLQDGARRIAIVGGGMIGCELAEDMALAGHTVTLLDRNRHPLFPLLPEKAGRLLRQSLTAEGIEYRGDEQVTGMEERDSGERAIHLSGGDTLIFDQVIAATGLMTDNRLARLAQLEFDGGIRVDPTTLQSSQPDIYALGDCITIDQSACRFIEPLPAQAKTIAHQVTGDTGVLYQHNEPVIRLKCKALGIVIHGKPRRDAAWEIKEEGDSGMTLEQRQDGVVVSTLEVGNGRQARET